MRKNTLPCVFFLHSMARSNTLVTSVDNKSLKNFSIASSAKFPTGSMVMSRRERLLSDDSDSFVKSLKDEDRICESSTSLERYIPTIISWISSCCRSDMRLSSSSRDEASAHCKSSRTITMGAFFKASDSVRISLEKAKLKPALTSLGFCALIPSCICLSPLLYPSGVPDRPLLSSPPGVLTTFPTRISAKAGKTRSRPGNSDANLASTIIPIASLFSRARILAHMKPQAEAHAMYGLWLWSMYCCWSNLPSAYNPSTLLTRSSKVRAKHVFPTPEYPESMTSCRFRLFVHWLNALPSASTSTSRP